MIQEVLSPSLRFRILADDSPLPPWAGHVFTCANHECQAEWMLIASDVCTAIDGTGTGYFAPRCKCGHVTCIDLPYDGDFEKVANLLALALLPQSPEPDAE